jgi:hypothetical protein
MKTYFNFRSSLSNGSWSQRGLTALVALAVAAAVGIALIQALRPSAQVMPAAPAAQVAHTAVPNPSAPSSGTGSASDGSAYVDYLLSGPSAGSAEPALPTPTPPVIGTGSAYNGGSYGSTWPTAQAQPAGLGIDLPAGTDLRGLPTGLTDYLRRNP